MSTVLDRFLRYVTYDTQSNEASNSYPSTEKQLALLRDLAEELRDIGLAAAVMDSSGYGDAEIVTAAAELIAHPEISHGAVRIAFTPDEEVGRGTKYFDVGRFGAICAYTMDGGERGEVESESFSADAMTVTFDGFNTHPGYAKGRMINAIKIAADFIHRLPADRLSPETTDGHDGFVHPYVVQASVERTSVRLLIRDFETDRLREKESAVKRLAQEAVAAHPGAWLETAAEESY